MDNSWALNTETIVFSKLKAKLTASLKNKYPDLNITEDFRLKENTKFPTVLVQFVSAYERGATLEGDAICAVSLTVQIDTYVTKKQGFNVAREVEGAILNAMKSMLFQTTMQNVELDNNDVFTTIMRFDRVIASGDSL